MFDLAAHHSKAQAEEHARAKACPTDTHSAKRAAATTEGIAGGNRPGQLRSKDGQPIRRRWWGPTIFLEYISVKFHEIKISFFDFKQTRPIHFSF